MTMAKSPVSLSFSFAICKMRQLSTSNDTAHRSKLGHGLAHPKRRLHFLYLFISLLRSLRPPGFVVVYGLV
jgi:hypothetical protein